MTGIAMIAKGEGEMSAQAFVDHLKRAAAEVATWPEWKQGLLGGPVTPRQPTEQDAEIARLRLLLGETAMDRWKEGTDLRTRFELPVSFLESPSCGWKLADCKLIDEARLESTPKTR